MPIVETDDAKRLALWHSGMARNRVQRMKRNAGQARAAEGGFPYPARTQAEVREDEG